MGKRSRRKNRNRKALGKKLGNLGKLRGHRADDIVFDDLIRLTPESMERMRQRLRELESHESASPVSNHAQGLAQDRGASIDAKWAYAEWQKIQAKNAHLPVEHKYKPWTKIDAETPDPDAEALSRVCIWCGITCESIEALEEHEETCA